MKFLFNYQGKHIANFVNGQLHAPNGRNIGHFLMKEGIFIDMHGQYLGEIVRKDRLLSRSASSYKVVNLGIYGDYGNVGNYGNPGNYGKISLIDGFDDIDEKRLRGDL